MVFFDIDDTLTDSDGAHLKAIRSLVMNRGIRRDPTEAELAPWLMLMEKYLQWYFRGELSLEQQRAGRVVDYFATLGIALSKEEALLYYQDYHRMFLDHCTLFGDVHSALDRLSGCQLGIISNGVTSDQLHKLSKNGILDVFSHVVISDAIGVAKPDRRLFEHAARLAGKPTQACTYIGNSYELDFLGAVGAGMTGYWLNRTCARKAADDRAGFGSLNEIVEEIQRSG